MKELIENLNFEQAIVVTAPPGWGKTYKLLNALKKTNRKVIFVFPLRALCDEVFISASKFNINVCNLRSQEDLAQLDLNYFQLIVTTPECLKLDYIEELSLEYLFVLDECHLFYYWGDSFREYLNEFFEAIRSSSPSLILLSATISESLFNRLKENLKFHYKDIYHLDFGNQKLKNYPNKIFYYPAIFKKWIWDDLYFNKDIQGVLVFCPFREQVKKLTKQFQSRGITAIGCVGGEAQEFTQKLYGMDEPPQVIFATSVVSHGVNLPNIKKVYFLSKVQNIDFYLQMVGRGGRQGDQFEIHTQNTFYFSNFRVLAGLVNVLLKRIRNKVNIFLYYLNAS